LDTREQQLTLNVGAIIWATGWRPYDANKIQPYGSGRFPNFISSVEFERRLDPFGPTAGKILRPSDGKEARDVAFIQCAGSCDINHLRHCSRICCMASLKQTTCLRERYGDDFKASLYYIDIRAIDRIDDSHQWVQQDPNVTFIKSKVANITEDKATGNAVLHGVDTEGYHRYSNPHELVVLATGMEPSVSRDQFPMDVVVNGEGFVELDEANGAFFAAGCSADTLDVNRAMQSATASALRAIQVVNRVAAAEEQTVSDQVKIGAYICKGCGLGERLDTAQLETIAAREGKASVVKEHNFLCSGNGVQMIQNDIDTEGVNRVVICACSRRANSEALNFDNVAIARANLRVGVIWVRPDTDEARETTGEMAADYVRMGCLEAKHMTPPSANKEAAKDDHILIVGGGVSGMTAAIEPARAGYPVTIVEKAGQLGGATGLMWNDIPAHSPYTDPVDTAVEKLTKELENSDKVTVHLNSVVTKTSAAPGRFSADISTESGATTTANYAAIIMASGAKAYGANQLPELGYGKSSDLATQLELEKLATDANGGAIKRPSDGKEVTSVVFVQCAGHRSQKEGHLPYCSGHCCLTSIKQAMYFKDRNPDISTNVIFTDLRTPGAAGENFYRSGQDKAATFTKGEVSEVVANGGSLQVKYSDLILAEDSTAEVDLVVLAPGLVPNSGVDIEAPAATEGEGAESQPSRE